MKDKFLTWIGCTPPWFPDQTDVCQGSVYIKEYRECMIAKYVNMRLWHNMLVVRKELGSYLDPTMCHYLIKKVTF